MYNEPLASNLQRKIVVFDLRSVENEFFSRAVRQLVARQWHARR